MIIIFKIKMSIVLLKFNSDYPCLICDNHSDNYIDSHYHGYDDPYLHLHGRAAGNQDCGSNTAEGVAWRSAAAEFRASEVVQGINDPSSKHGCGYLRLLIHG